MASRILTSSHGLVFGFRWSLVGVCLALFYIASCDLFVPPDNNSPRYNQVIGTKKRPSLNPGGANYQPMQGQSARQSSIDEAYGASEAMQAGATLTTPAAPLAQPAPVAPAAATAAPAPAPRPEARAAPAAAQEEPSFWSRLAFWSDDEPERVAEIAKSERRMPAENQAMHATVADVPATPVASAELAPLPGTPNAERPMQMAANESYPKLYTTPERPSPAATDNTRQRLGATRSDLEADRAVADQDRARLARDAVAEPSLLSTMPELQRPQPPAALPPPPAAIPPAPVSRGPMAPPVAPIASAPANSAFERLTNRPLTAAAPAPVSPAAPAPHTNVAPPDSSTPLPALASVTDSAPRPAPTSVDIAPAPAIASVAPPVSTERTLEPIRLTPPPGVIADNTMAATPQTPPASGAIALTPPQSFAETQSFLPGSRYSQRRTAY